MMNRFNLLFYSHKKIDQQT